jgi:AhpD family alkylhydroperoxidase
MERRRTMGNKIKEFSEFRKHMNEKIMNSGNREIKRFFSLDKNVYDDGALTRKTKELMGLTSSLVLRCQDCVTYHLSQLNDIGVTDEELYEAFSVALVVGGSITIPHLRKAVAMVEDMKKS